MTLFWLVTTRTTRTRTRTTTRTTLTKNILQGNVVGSWNLVCSFIIAQLDKIKRKYFLLLFYFKIYIFVFSYICIIEINQSHLSGSVRFVTMYSWYRQGGQFHILNTTQVGGGGSSANSNQIKVECSYRRQIVVGSSDR